jgi:hypothetical protein
LKHKITTGERFVRSSFFSLTGHPIIQFVEFVCIMETDATRRSAKLQLGKIVEYFIPTAWDLKALMTVQPVQNIMYRLTYELDYILKGHSYKNGTADSLLTHTPRWATQSMGYESL